MPADYVFNDASVITQIEEALDIGYNENKKWFLFDKVLYDLCEQYPTHTNDHQIVAKIGLIGRSYSASVERRKNAERTKGDFYYGYIAPAIRESELDARISELKQFQFPTADNMGLILSTHKYFQDVLKECTELEKRSLASKYLHFHLPNLFYIFDSYSETAINKIVKTVSKWKCPCDADYTYAKYFEKSLFIQTQIAPEVPNFPRILDSFLQMLPR